MLFYCDTLGAVVHPLGWKAKLFWAGVLLQLDVIQCAQQILYCSNPKDLFFT